MNRNLYRLFVLLMVSLSSMASWAQYNPENPAEPGAYYRLNLQVTPSNGGSFNISTSTTRQPGVSVNLRAYSNTDFVFVAWTEEGIVISTDAQFNYRMPEHDVTLTAHFDYRPSSPGEPIVPEIPVYSMLYVSCSPSAGGSVNVSSGNRYVVGTSVSLKAYNNTDFAFVNWTDNGEVISTSSSFNYVVKEYDAQLVAHFQYAPSNPAEPPVLQPTHKLYLTTNPLGAGSFNISSGSSYQPGSTVSLNAYVNSGYTFLNWTENDSVISYATSFSYIMPDNDVTLTANYQQSEYNPSNPSEPGSPTEERHNIFGMTENAIPGQRILYPIYLENSTPLMNMYIDITFPEGFVVDSANSVLSGRAGNHWLEKNALENNTWRMRIRGTDIINGTNGKVIEIPVTVPDSAKMGKNYLIALTHGVIMRTDSTQIPVGVRSGNIYVEKLLEDGLYASFSLDKYQNRVAFQNHSAGNIQSVLWDFGDGTQSTEQHPLHIYSDAGTYNVRLTIQGEVEEDIMETTVLVNDPTTWKVEGTFWLDSHEKGARRFSSISELLTTFNQGNITGNVVVNVMPDDTYHLDLATQFDLLKTIFDKFRDVGKQLTFKKIGVGGVPVVKLGSIENHNATAAQQLLSYGGTVAWQGIETHLYGLWVDFNKVWELQQQIIPSGGKTKPVDFTEVSPVLDYKWTLSSDNEFVKGKINTGSGILPEMVLVNEGEGNGEIRYDIEGYYNGKLFCTLSHAMIVAPALVGLFNNLTPADNALLDVTTVTLTWNRILNATYDVFVWDSVNAPSNTPLVSNTQELRYTSKGFFRNGHTYHWVVVAGNGAQRMTSDTMTFSIRSLPNLHVTQLDCSEPIAEQPITVNWAVRNDGPGSTGEQRWTDYVWLVTDAFWGTKSEINDSRLPKLLAQVDNVKALDSGEEYENSIEVTLPKEVYGDVYLMVTTDMYSVTEIEWSHIGGSVLNPYEPSITGNPYKYLYATTSVHYNKVYETDETVDKSDNFRYRKIHLAVPPMVDLQVSQVSAEVIPIYTVSNALHPDLPTMILYVPTPLSYAGLKYSTDFYSGKTIAVKATIVNKGDIALENGKWRSGVYMSNHNNRTEASQIWLMATKSTEVKALKPNESVEVKFVFDIPYTWSGSTYFHVMTDLDDNINELANKENNWGETDEVQVKLTPTADFVGKNLNAPTTLVSNQEFNVHYEVKNIGKGVPYKDIWYDKIYLSSSPDTIDRNAKLLLTKKRLATHRAPITEKPTNGLFLSEHYTYEGDNYTANEKIKIDGVASGTYYLHVLIDANDDILEENGEANNIISSGPIQFVEPDLSITLKSISEDTLTTADVVAFTWIVKNEGMVGVQNATLTDAIYTTINQDGTSATLLTNIENTITLEAGQEKTLRANVNIPKNPNLNGVRYVYMKTNAKNTIKESNNSNNQSNILKSYFTYTEEAKTPTVYGPALKVSNIRIPESIVFGDTMLLTCQITNIGDRRVLTDVAKEVYIMQGYNNELNKSTATKCTIIAQEGSTDSLRSESHVNVRIQFVIPASVKGGKNTLFVLVDPTNAINAKSTKNNMDYHQFYTDQNLPDLRVTQLLIPDTVTTSATDTLSFTISNEGEWKSPRISTNVYLSKDTIANQWSDILLTSIQIPEMQPGEQMSYHPTISIDDKNHGKWYIVIAPDLRNVTSLTNKNKTAAQSLVVTLAPQPDLRITAATTGKVLVAGEKISISYSVQNIGSHATRNKRWADEYWLCSSPMFDPNNAIKIGSRTHTGILHVGETYDATAEYMIPASLQGNYMLFVRTDAAQAIIEEMEDNNEFSISAYVNGANDRPADLILEDLVVPSNIPAGEEITLAYKVVNKGEYPAIGQLRDIIYLSTDTIWDLNDPMVGVISGQVNMSAGQEIVRTAVGRFENVVEGSYYLIIRTNSTRTISEQDRDNNIIVTSSPITVDVSELNIGAEMTVTTMGYYKLHVPSGFEGKNVALRLMHSEDIHAGLYVAHESMPSSAKYDFASGEFPATMQEIILPNVKKGNYYILAQNTSATQSVDGFEFSLSGANSSTPTSKMQISAEEIQFGATSLSLTEGGNGGWVTTTIQGAMFDSVMDFRLMQDDETIPAEVITWDGATQSVVTFNLNEVDEGTYDVVSELPNGSVSILPDAFTVVEGKSVALGLKLDFPTTIRQGAYVPFTFAYANGGTTDIEIAEFVLVIDNGYLSFTLQGLANGEQEIRYKPHGDTNSRGYVSIPPGEQEVVKVYFQPLGVCSMSLYIVK